MPIRLDQIDSEGNILPQAPAQAPAPTQGAIPRGVLPAAVEEGLRAYQQAPPQRSLSVGGMTIRPSKSREELEAELIEKKTELDLQSEYSKPERLGELQNKEVLSAAKTVNSLRQLRQLIDENPKKIVTGLAEEGFPIPAFEHSRVGLGGMIGKVKRQYQDPVVTKFAKGFFRMADAYRIAVTGAQAGYAEIATFLPASLPDPVFDRPEQFKVALDSFEIEVLQGLDAASNSMRAQGFTEKQIDQMIGSIKDSVGIDDSAAPQLEDPLGIR